MAIGGLLLKSLQTGIYALAFCCSAVILALYSYFLAEQASHDQSIPTEQKAVEGMSGVAVLYTIAAVIFTCCLGGVRFFAFVAIVLDILFCGAFIALAVLTRHGASSCNGFVNTPIGEGDSNVGGDYVGYGSNGGIVQYGVSLKTACHMNSACFAVSIIGAVLFLIAAFIQLWLGRHHQREKRYGPSPANGYTAGSKPSFFNRRKRGVQTTKEAYANENGVVAPAATAGGLAVPAHHNNRISNDTAYTGTTAGDLNGNTFTGNKYETTQTVPTTGGYHTGVTGTAVNPYGYENSTTYHAPTTTTAVNY